MTVVTQPAPNSFAGPTQRQHFYPYEVNGGSILAISGADFCVIASDTRQTRDYDIQTRYAPKVFRLSVLSAPASVCFHPGNHADYLSVFRTDKAILAVNGFAADGNMFVKKVKRRLEVRACFHCVFVVKPMCSIATCKINSCIAMHMQRTCPCAPLRGSFKICFTNAVSSRTMSITSSAVSMTMVRLFLPPLS
jgi:hypothetical protein